MKNNPSPNPVAQLIILLAGLAVLGGGLIWFAGRYPAVPAAQTNGPAAGGGEIDALTVRMETFSEKTPTVETDVRYPQVDGIADKDQAEQLNSELRNTAMAWKDAFTRDVTGAPDPLGSKSSINVEATVAYLSPEIMSVRYEASVYSAGAAHPNLLYKTLNWDIAHAVSINTDDLFVAEADWVTRFSELSIADLERQFADAGDDFEALSADIRSGAGPRAENFRAWTMDRDGITLHFEPYQVAAYAAGPQHVDIPWRELAALLDPAATSAAIRR